MLANKKSCWPASYKSLSFPSGLSSRIWSKTQREYSFLWQMGSLPYLGIELTSTTAMLYKAKLSAFIGLLRDMKRCSSLALVGRITAVKMVLLLKVLYYFCTLPVAVSVGELQRFQNKILRFIWGPRVMRCSLYTRWELGGLEVPDLRKDYRWTSWLILYFNLISWIESP